MFDQDWLDDVLSGYSARRERGRNGQPKLICGLWICRDGRMFVHAYEAEAHTVRLKD